MIMKNQQVLAFVLVGAFLAGCDSFDAPTVVGSGVIKTESRTISDCSEIDLYGVGELTIHIGDQPSLSIMADDNLLQYVKSEVSGDKLSIGVGPGNYTWNGFPKMELTVTSLDSITLSGQTQAIASDLDIASLTVTADGQCSVTLGGKIEELTVNLSGQSSCSTTGVEGSSASIDARGQCSVTLEGGMDDVSIRVSDQSNCDATGLEAGTAKVRADGQSAVRLADLQSLEVVADGASYVTYHSATELTETRSGLATVTKQE